MTRPARQGARPARDSLGLAASGSSPVLGLGVIARASLAPRRRRRPHPPAATRRVEPAETLLSHQQRSQITAVAFFTFLMASVRNRTRADRHSSTFVIRRCFQRAFANA